MNGFERRKERKKEGIRQAALELFQVYGFEKVTLGDIARRANVSPVTIYNHFGSKEELVREVIKTLVLNNLEKYRAIIKGEGTFKEKLELIVFDKKNLMGQFQGELIQRTIKSDPEIQQFFESIWQHEVNQMMVDFFKEGQRQGFVNPELSGEAILVYYEILRRGIFASSGIVNTEHDIRLMNELMSLFLYGLVGKSE